MIQSIQTLEYNLNKIDTSIDEFKQNIINHYGNIQSEIELRVEQLKALLDNKKETMLEQLNMQKNNSLNYFLDEDSELVKERNESILTLNDLKVDFNTIDQVKAIDIVNDLNKKVKKIEGLLHSKVIYNYSNVYFKKNESTIETDLIGLLGFNSKEEKNKKKSLENTSDLNDPEHITKLHRVEIFTEKNYVTKAIWPLSKLKIVVIVERDDGVLMMRLINSDGKILYQINLCITSIIPKSVSNKSLVSLRSTSTVNNSKVSLRSESRNSNGSKSFNGSYLSQNGDEDYDIDCITYENYGNRTLLLLQKNTTKQYVLQMYDNTNLRLLNSKLLVNKLYPSFMNDREILCHSEFEPHIRILDYNLDEVEVISYVNKSPFKVNNPYFFIYGSTYQHIYIGYIANANFEIYNRRDGSHFRSIRPFSEPNWICKIDSKSRLLVLSPNKLIVKVFDMFGNELFENTLSFLERFSFFRITSENEIAFTDYDTNTIILVPNFP
jgi:hypothetical protein